MREPRLQPGPRFDGPKWKSSKPIRCDSLKGSDKKSGHNGIIPFHSRLVPKVIHILISRPSSIKFKLVVCTWMEMVLGPIWVGWLRLCHTGSNTFFYARTWSLDLFQDFTVYFGIALHTLHLGIDIVISNTHSCRQYV